MGKDFLDSCFDALGNAVDSGADALGKAVDRGADALGRGIDAITGSSDSSSSKNDDITITKNTDGSTTVHIPKGR